MTVIELVVALVAILGAAFLFTNAVEILGERLNLGQGAVGSVLAAVGTALPETMIPVVAIVEGLLAGGNPGSSEEIGVGAILGAPFLLATLAMFVVGASVLGFRRRRGSGSEVTIDETVVARDVSFFLICFAAAAGTGLVTLPVYVKAGVAALLIGAYVFYVWRTLKAGGASLEETPKRLTLWPLRSRAPTWAVAAQVVGSLAIMTVGAHFFVVAVEHGSEALGVPAGLISLILAPLATELPEKFNSVVWLRKNKDTLAFGNITGAMVFQSTVPVALGLLFTRWELGWLNVLCVVLALVSGALLYTALKSARPIRASYLLGGGVLYAAFLVAAVFAVTS